MKRQKKRIIGLTGSIGSGKSTVSARLAKLGANVLDADAVSRALLEPGGGCFDAVVRAFGTEILRSDGTIDRKALAAVVFADEARRAALNDIVHPRVKERMTFEAERLLSEQPETPVILDVPLLFETGMDAGVDETVFVYAPDYARIARIVARDGCTPEHARLRMAAQMPQEEKRRLADVTLDNSGTIAELYRQADAWYRALTRVEE